VKGAESMNEEKENTAMYGKMKIVAEKALERYLLNISEISFLCVETNVFLKQSPGKEKSML